MSDPHPDPAAYRRRRLRDAALILPLAGATLLLGPLAGLGAGRTVLGLPATLVWLFAVWLALILGARWLSRRLRE